MDIYDLAEKINELNERGYHVHYIVHTSNQEIEQLVEVHLKNLNTENEYVGSLSYLTLNDMYQSMFDWLYTHEGNRLNNCDIPCDTCIHRPVCQYKITCERMYNEFKKTSEQYDTNMFTFSICCKYFEKSESISREGRRYA